MKTRLYRLLLVSLGAASLISISSGLSAQSEPPVQIDGVALTLKKTSDIRHGKARILSSKAPSDGHHYYVEHLTMFQPMMVILMAGDPKNPVRLELAKYRFNEPIWTGETDKEGAVSHQFRTQGEVKINVKPANEDTSADYSLIVWAADLPEPDLPIPAIHVSEAEGAGSNFGWLKYLAGVLGLAAFAFFFFKLGRRT